jgi:DNA mismatch repair protein MutL
MTDRPVAGKRTIRPLPERLINKIAAGEVIERPAAVLKELVENSFDAGATRIEVIVEKSGTKLISVIDDGCGIESSQVEVAFSRHATSKIADFDDLESLRSYGFRGEALPSVGSVSRTRMITRTPDSEIGTEIVIEGGVVQNVKPKWPTCFTIPPRGENS